MMDVLVNDRHFHNGKVTMKLSLLQWLKLKLDGRVKVFEAAKPGCEGLMPFHIAKCNGRTGCGEYFLDYIHGNSRLDCPHCNGPKKRRGVLTKPREIVSGKRR